MSDNTQQVGNVKSLGRTRVIWGLVGLVAGAVLCGGMMFALMPSMMLNVHESRYATVEETCAALEKAIEKQGWSSPATRNMNKAMSKHGVEFPSEVRIVELCKAEYAEKVLTTNPEVLTLMPCAWGVYKGQDDKIYITGMNMGLMGKMFGGTIAEVMGGSVAADEHSMLSEVIVD